MQLKGAEPHHASALCLAMRGAARVGARFVRRRRLADDVKARQSMSDVVNGPTRAIEHCRSRISDVCQPTRKTQTARQPAQPLARIALARCPPGDQLVFEETIKP